MRYALNLVRASRPKSPTAPDFVKKWVAFGASVRAAQYLVLGGKARALTSGRYHVSFDDIRALAHPVLRHRVLTNFHAQSEGVTTDTLIDRRCSSRCRCRGRGCNDHGDQGRGRVRASKSSGSWTTADSRRAVRRSRSCSSRIGNLELVARHVVDGFINGLHRSPYFGASVDFAEHRGYVPGDDIRRVDWRLCRADRSATTSRSTRRTRTPTSRCCSTSRSRWASAAAASRSSTTRKYLAGCLDLPRRTSSATASAWSRSTPTSSSTCRRRRSTWTSCCTCSTG